MDIIMHCVEHIPKVPNKESLQNIGLPMLVLSTVWLTMQLFNPANEFFYGK